MIISGLVKTTLLDYPSHVAATIFLGGCNLRCPFCHNSSFLEHPVEEYTLEELFAFLKKRQGILDGVCISGGEPTLNPELPEFIKKIRDLGYLIKLDTNGTNPDMLEILMENYLLDYVAMDIKSSLDEYEKCCGCSVNLSAILRSISILLEGRIPYEFRTTVVKELHTAAAMKNMGQLLKGADQLFLQSFVNSDGVTVKDLHAPSLDQLKEYKEILQHYVSNVFIRGS
ncbi:MAG: anaerobic ribonucleoside-triphosphate reductase activating protein [Lachnospiraceae bacterium]|nr:anaerobic ribonucleoside-triphosphate reductase activating protein [Lachnospiraceae bacterium]